MQEIITSVRLSDDLDYARDGTKTEAAVTIAIGLDGQWRELDLSEAHDKELKEFLRPYIEAGRLLKDAPVLRTVKKSSPSQVAYLKGLREFAQSNGIKYRTSTGKHYYPVSLRKQYAEYLREQGETPEPPEWLE